MMDPHAVFSYVLASVVLFAKFCVAIAIQAKERFRERRFRYAEDATYWRGVIGDDTELCARAQGLLRNDCESQPYFLALGLAYLMLGARPEAAPLYFGAYSIARLAHAYFFLRARQPHRNRAFAASVLVLALICIHLVYVARTLRGR
jgi:uncharacterized membrane protein YecN with MAPEG domain